MLQASFGLLQWRDVDQRQHDAVKRRGADPVGQDAKEIVVPVAVAESLFSIGTPLRSTCCSRFDQRFIEQVCEARDRSPDVLRQKIEKLADAGCKSTDAEIPIKKQKYQRRLPGDRFSRSAVTCVSSSILCWYSALTVYSSSLTECSSSFVLCSSSLDATKFLVRGLQLFIARLLLLNHCLQIFPRVTEFLLEGLNLFAGGRPQVNLRFITRWRRLCHVVEDDQKTRETGNPIMQWL